METILRAGVYVRCSHDKRDGASVGQQAEKACAACDANRWQPVLYDADNDRSASRFSTDARPDWDRLLADLRAGQLGVVVLWETSRGDRKLPEWAAFLDDCRRRGALIHVITHQRTYDVRIARDWRTLAEDGIGNAYESEQTSLRVRRALGAAAADGRPHGQVQYGLVRRYDPATRAYLTQEPHPDTGPVAAEIIGRIARSEPLGRVRADLNARGVPSPSGGTWDRHTLRLMGLNPAYAGYRLPPREAGKEPDWAPLVALETHRAAVAVLTSPVRQPRPGRQKHLLSYLARCGACGAFLWVRTARSGGQYACQGRWCVNVGIAWLDGLVTLAVCGALAAPDAAAVFRSDSGEAARLRGEAARLQAELNEWAAADITAAAYQIREAKLLPQIRAAERAAAAAELPLVLRDLLTAGDVRARWDLLDVPARRHVIRALMDVSVARAPDRKRATRTDPERVIIAWRRT